MNKRFVKLEDGKTVEMTMETVLEEIFIPCDENDAQRIKFVKSMNNSQAKKFFCQPVETTDIWRLVCDERFKRSRPRYYLMRDTDGTIRPMTDEDRRNLINVNS